MNNYSAYTHICIYIYIYHNAYTTYAHSINSVGVDIAPFSAYQDEAELLLLPGLPLINLAGKNPEPDLWTFEIETPSASAAAMQSLVTIDYVHPGSYRTLT